MWGCFRCPVSDFQYNALSLYNFTSLKSIEIYFVAQNVVYHGEYFICPIKEYISVVVGCSFS